MAGSNDTDIFGLTKTSQNSTSIGHPSMVGITLPNGNNQIALCQSVQIDYQRQASPIYELGSENVYIAVQGATGSVQLSRAINSVDNLGGSALELYNGSGCVASPANLIINTSGRGNKDCHAQTGKITCEGATLARIGFQAQAGQAIITDSAEYVVGAVKVDKGSGSGSSGGSSGSGGSGGSQPATDNASNVDMRRMA